MFESKKINVTVPDFEMRVAKCCGCDKTEDGAVEIEFPEKPDDRGYARIHARPPKVDGWVTLRKVGGGFGGGEIDGLLCPECHHRNLALLRGER